MLTRIAVGVGFCLLALVAVNYFGQRHLRRSAARAKTLKPPKRRERIILTKTKYTVK
jgi:hypothetical protein